MVIIEPYSAVDQEGVLKLLKKFDASNMNAPIWRLLLDRTNPAGRPNGFVLKDDGLVCGFVGTIFSEQFIDGKKVEFCNLTSWIVDERYRGQSLSLLMPILRDKEIVITDLTASPEAQKILRAFKFEEFESKAAVFLKSRCQDIEFRFVREGSVPTEYEAIVSNHRGTKLIFIEFGKYPQSTLLGVTVNDLSFPFFVGKSPEIHDRVVSGGSYPVASLHFISNFKFFVENIECINFEVQRRLDVIGLFVEQRMVEEKYRKIFKWGRLPSPRLYRRVGDISPEKISNLYTELSILGVSGQFYLIYEPSFVGRAIKKIDGFLRRVMHKQSRIIEKFDRRISIMESELNEGRENVKWG